MLLGDFFTEKERLEFSQRSLKIGSVVKIIDNSAKPKPKEKRFVIIAETSDTVAFGSVYINSEINPNVIRTDKLKQLQVEIPATGQEYLTHTSYIDCSKIKSINKNELTNWIANNQENYLGDIEEKSLKIILGVVVSASTITTHEKTKFGLI